MRRAVVLLLLVFLCLPVAAENTDGEQGLNTTGNSRNTEGVKKNSESPLPANLPTVNFFKVRFRMAWSRFKLTDFPDNVDLFSWDMGASVNIPLSYSFAIETGLIYEINYMIIDGADEPTIWANYKMPVLGKYYFANGGSFGANAQLGLMYSFSFRNFVNSNAANFENHLSLVIGVGADFGKTMLDLRVVFGLGELVSNVKKTAFEFGVTF